MGLSLGGIKGLFRKSSGGSGGSCINTANPIKTGQTTSYATGDDGDLQEGRLTNFTTLDFTNVFGNTNRFTDELGGQTYASGIVIDNATQNQIDNKVKDFYTEATSRTFADHLTHAATLVVNSFSDWHMANIREQLLLLDFENSNLFGSLPASSSLGTLGGNLHSSTTFPSDAARTIAVSSATVTTTQSKAAARRTVFARTFTWNGSALT